METAGEGLLILIGTSGGRPAPAAPGLLVDLALSAEAARGAELAGSTGLAPGPQAIEAANRRVAIAVAKAAFMSSPRCRSVVPSLALSSEPRVRRSERSVPFGTPSPSCGSATHTTDYHSPFDRHGEAVQRGT